MPSSFITFLKFTSLSVVTSTTVAVEAAIMLRFEWNPVDPPLDFNREVAILLLLTRWRLLVREEVIVMRMTSNFISRCRKFCENASDRWCPLPPTEFLLQQSLWCRWLYDLNDRKWLEWELLQLSTVAESWEGIRPFTVQYRFTCCAAYSIQNIVR